MSKRTPKTPKKWHNTRVVLCWHEKILVSKKRQHISFVPQGGTYPTETIWLVVSDGPVCEKLIPKPGPNGKIFLRWHVDVVPSYHVKFHEFQPSFRFTKILKTMYPDVSGWATMSRCLTFILISCMWPKLATKDNHFILQPVFRELSMCFDFELCTWNC